MSVTTISRVRVKRIRRRAEDGAAVSSYLCRSHDPRERALLVQTLRMADHMIEAGQRLRAQTLLLMEINEDEDKRHMEHWYGDRAINQELAESEQNAEALAG